MITEDCGAVYCVLNVVTGQRYVGSTKRVRRRWTEHINALKRGKHANEHLQNSWNKYGEDSFIFYVLEYGDECSLFDIETRFIQEFKTYDRSLGYNKTTEARISARSITDETRKKMSDAKRGWSPPPSTRAANVAAVKGKKQSPDHVKKRFDSRRRNGNMRNSPEAIERAAAKMRGRVYGADVRKKMSDGTKRLSNADLHAICYLRANGMSCPKIADLAQVDKSTITEAIRGRHGYTDAAQIMRDACDNKLAMALSRALAESASTRGDK